jgi:quercetin dioxygenase-like cupin family protein
LTAYSIKNLQEIEDSVGARAPGIEGRFAREHLDSKELGVSYFRFDAGMRSPRGHHHREQEEAYVVVGGSGRVKLDEEIIELRRWDAIRVAPETVRGFEAGSEGLEIIAIGGSKPQGGDGVTVADWWS